MKQELERIDYGGHPKYSHAGAFGSALFPGRSARFDSTKKQQGFSLFDLNPHKGSLGLNLQEFTAEKLCPRPSLADLHSDPGLAAAATAADPAAAEADGILERSVSPQPAAAAAGDLQTHQQQRGTENGTAAAADADADAGGQRKRQKLSQQQATPAAAAAAGAAGNLPSLDTLTSISDDLAQNGAKGSANNNDEFVIIGSSSSSSGGSDSESDSDSAEAGDAGRHGSRHRDSDNELIVISSDDNDDGGPAAAAAAAAAAGDGGLSGKQRRQQQQQQQQQQEGEEGSDDMSISISDSDSESAGGDDDDDGDDDHTVTMTEGGSEDDEFIPLLDIQPGQGNDGTAAAAGSTHQQQKQQRAVGYQPPWLLRLAHFGSPLMRLHNEIVAFCQMLAPTAEEVASRASSLDSLKEVVRSIWPVADVKVFGSYETGLYTPASDTDVVVVGSGNVNAQTGLRALAGALEARHLVRNMQQVLGARVPIIKFEMIDSGLAFDVSWEVPSGPHGAQVVKQLLQQWPALKPLALVLKVFLTQRELNEVYTGGVGSYTLIIMIVAFLQLHHSRRPQQQQGSKRRRSGGSGHEAEPLEANLGLLLVDFMRLYGRVLNLNRVGITCKGSGCYFDRCSKEGFMHSNRGKGGFVVPGRVTLAVEDPIDPTNDTARGSYNMKTVRQVFDHAYQLLNASCPVNVSMLGRIVHLAPVISGRPVPPWCVEAPSGRSGGSSSSKHRRSSSRDRDRERDRKDRDSGRDRLRDRGRERDTDWDGAGERDRDRKRGRGDREHSSGSRDRSRSGRDHRSSSGKSRKHKRKDMDYQQKQKQRGGGGKKQRRNSGQQDRGQQQQQQDGRQQRLEQYHQGSPGSSKGGMNRSYGSRQSFGSGSEREYGHKDKRRRY